MRKFNLLWVVLFVAWPLKAQFEIGGGIGSFLPVSSFADRAQLGADFRIIGKYAFTEHWKAEINAGMSKAAAKENYNSLLMGYGIGAVQYYFLPGYFKCYVSAGFCLSDYNNYKGAGTKIGFAPAIGFEYPISSNVYLHGSLTYFAPVWDANPKYPFITTNSTIDLLNHCLNIGVLFSIGGGKHAHRGVTYSHSRHSSSYRSR